MKMMNYVMLKEVCAINMGQSPDSDSYNENGEGVPFFQGNADFGERYPVTRKWCTAPTKMAAAEDILISVRAPIGAMNYATEECCIGRGLAALTPNKTKVSPEFIFWLLKGKNEELNNKGTGSTFKAIGRKVLEETLVPDIDLEVQIECSKILEKVYSIIQNRKQELQKLDELVKARFIELFVETDEASEWSYHTIADVSNDMRTGPFGSALHHDEFVDSGVFVLGIDNAVENKFSYNRMRYITEEKYQQLKRYTVYPGDVIITIMGTVGHSAVIPVDMPKAINTKHLACITPNVEMINAQFLSCAFQLHPDIRTQLKKQCKGAIMAGLNLTIIKGLSFRIPPINLQKKFVEFYEQTDKSKFQKYNATILSHNIYVFETRRRFICKPTLII